MYHQLFISPLIYRNREVLRVARPYQLISVYLELHPEEMEMRSIFEQYTDEIAHELMEIDVGNKSPDYQKLNEYKLILESLISTKLEDEILSLAYEILETGNDNYPVITESGIRNNQIREDK